MSSNPTQSTVNERDEQTITEKVRENPRPAAIWLAGIFLLLVIEGGRIAGGIRTHGETVVGIAGIIPESMLSAVAGGGLSGLATASLLVFVLYFIGLAIATWTRLSLVDSVTDRLTADRRQLVDGAVFGGIIAIGWAVAVVTGLSAVLGTVGGGVQSLVQVIESLPTVTSRETIPNEGYQTPDGTWHGTFAGLSPAQAWALRVVLIYLYAAVFALWIWVGYLWYRKHYRRLDWTPTDDVIGRLRTHRWGQFGMVIVFLFLTMALFAPSLATAPADQNLYSPYDYSISYYDDDTSSVETIPVGDANLQTQSRGYSEANIGPMSYDQFDRFHPAGTLTNGKDLFTFLMYGSRISLVIALLSIGISGLLATGLALTSAYFRGVADLVVVVIGDTIMGVPRLLMLILMIVVLSDTWLGQLYDGGILLALVLAGTGWPFLWRAFRGPALQTAQEDWVRAAQSYGQSSGKIMRQHILPYMVGYILIYSSLVLGGVILAVAGLSFLGFGITEPTPEWGRAVDMGQNYVASSSWHISLIPGVMITLVVMGFNAMGDGLRDAVDPQADQGDSSVDTASRGGGV